MQLLPKGTRARGHIIGWATKSLLTLPEPELVRKSAAMGHRAWCFKETMTALNPVQTIDIRSPKPFAFHDKTVVSPKRSQAGGRNAGKGRSLPKRFAFRLGPRYPHELSGGQRTTGGHRHAIRAAPPVLLFCGLNQPPRLDVPDAGADP